MDNSKINLDSHGAHLIIGDYNTSKPNTVGCSKNDVLWYSYTVGDKRDIAVYGPMSMKSAVTYCIRFFPFDKEVLDKYHYDYADTDALINSYESKEEAIQKSSK